MASPSRASAGFASHVVISELQTASTVSASHEFIELYNPTENDISLSGWVLEYKSAVSLDAPTSWTKKASLSGQLSSHGFYLVAPRAYLLTADAELTASMAGSGGVIRLRDAAGIVVDQVAYGAGSVGGEGGSPASSPSAGQSLERLPGRLNEAGGNGIDTNNNTTDFMGRALPEPQDTRALLEVPGEPLPPEPDEAPATYGALAVTELFVNPASPQTDSQHEFIELHNPSSGPVNMKGYILRSGAEFKDSFVLPDEMLEAGGYVAFYAPVSRLSLTNSGGVVQILDPAGSIIMTTDPYDTAPDGHSWSWIDDDWRWTKKATPGAPNELVVSPLTAVKAAAKTLTKPKVAAKSTKPKSATKSKAASKPKAAKKAKQVKGKAANRTTRVAGSRNFQPASWLLITLAVFTIGYATYEFRHDIYRLYYRLRGHSKPRGSAGPPFEGRGSD